MITDMQAKVMKQTAADWEKKAFALQERLDAAVDTINELIGTTQQHKDRMWLALERLEYAQAMAWQDRAQEQIDAISRLQTELDDTISSLTEDVNERVAA